VILGSVPKNYVFGSESVYNIYGSGGSKTYGAGGFGALVGNSILLKPEKIKLLPVQLNEIYAHFENFIHEMKSP
jgi:hypothetical protein